MASADVTVKMETKISDPVQFVVRRRDGGFVLNCEHAFTGNRYPMITAPTAQMILDYAQQVFVPGISIYWEIYAKE